jgi:endonuclease I
VEVKLDGVGVLIKYIDLMVTYSFLDLRTHPEYYQDIDPDLSGEVLLLALRALINDGFVGVTYGEARYILAESDANPNNPDEIILFYLRTIVDNTWDGGNTWNREHVWPQSYLGSGDIDNETINIASDLHNLKPTNPLENSSRGNKYFDNLTTSSTYEPHDDVKGDVARILLYMIVMYDYLELVNNPSGSEVYQMGVLETLLEWHIIDPVDDFELNRNNVIYFYQGNRNPFIDRSDYVDLIWGELEE